MKRFWRVLAKPVTAPVNALKRTARLLTMRNRAEAVLETAEQAERDPTLYRTPHWWLSLIERGWALWDVLPIAPEVKQMKLLNTLIGFRSYLVALGIGSTAAAQNLGYIDDGTAALIFKLLAAGGVAALRAAIANALAKK